MEPKVSIIVPVYNAAPYLGQCIESLINQTYRNLEIILIDDGSSDESPNICSEYSIRDSRISVIVKKNEGASLARKAGIEKATGAYILFSDSDDWLDKTAVLQLVNFAIRDDADCVLFSYVKEYKNESVKNPLFEENFCYDDRLAEERIHQRVIGPDDEALKCPERINNLSTTWGKLYRREVALRGIIVNERETGCNEDTLFNIYALDGCRKISYINECFYHYRKNNPNSLTARYIPDMVEKWDVFYRYIDDYICKTGQLEYAKLLSNRVACGMIGLGINEIHAPVGFRKKVKSIRKVLNRPRYIQAFGKMSIRYCPLKWKVFFLLCRYRCAHLLTCLLNVIEYIRGRKNTD